MAFPPGARLGPYEILGPLGAGGMGEVYRARDTRLGRDVALKVLPEEVSSDGERLARFEREARTASSLSHPNIIAIYDVGRSDGRAFIVMELAEGQTLRALLASGPLGPRRLLEIGVQIAEGLARAHAAGTVHRDLKPENVIVTGDGLVKILDFGLAKAVPAAGLPGSNEEPTLSRVTEPGTVLGTVDYMSPEQATGEEVDFRSDQFALGVILYELATGHRPFQRRTPAETLAAILRDDPPAVASVNPRMPPRLAAILGRCLAKDPSHRYAATLDLARDLREELNQLSTGSGRAEPARTIAPRGRAVVVALALLAAAAAGLVLRLGARKAPIDSLAILPFVNASGDPGLDYLSDGLTENLIDSVSQVTRLKVIARSSVFRYKGRDVAPEQVARELKVRAVLMGRISERGDSLTVSAELVDAAESAHLWGARYHRKPSDLLATEEDIAREISENLRLRLSGDEEKQVTRRYTQDDQAYRDYLKGRYFWNQRTKDGLYKAIEYFRQAIGRDPTYALAYSGLADAYSTLGVYYYQFAPPGEAFPPAREAALKALDLDPSLGAAHASLAYVLLHYDWDWAAAGREFRRALELGPADVDARHSYSHYLLALGRFDESLAEARRAVDQDPLSPMMSTHLGEHYYLARQPDLAVEQLKRALELSPRFPAAHVLLGEVYEYRKVYGDAEREFRATTGAFASTSRVRAALARLHAQEGRRAEALRELEDLAADRSGAYVAPHDLAWGYAALGDVDRAMDWLERAYAERSSALVYVRIEPLFDPLRGDRRFADLVRRMDFPP
jgi:serine/threonine protein kinase/tetratricopeptide (TPR) repeat protein